MFLSLLIIGVLILAMLSVVLFCYMLNPLHLKQFEQTKSNYKNFRSRKSSNSTESNDASTKYCSDDSTVITTCNGFAPTSDERNEGTDHYDSVKHDSNCNGSCAKPTAPEDQTNENNNVEHHNVDHHANESAATNSTDV